MCKTNEKNLLQKYISTLYLRIKWWKRISFGSYASKSLFLNFEVDFLHCMDFVGKHTRSFKYLEFLKQLYMTYCYIVNCPVIALFK